MTNQTTLHATARQRADRKHHTREIMALLRAGGPKTQAQIARETGLSKAAVNHIVQALRDEGAVEYDWKNKREALVTLASTRGSVATLTVREAEIHGILFDFTAQSREDVRPSEFTGQDKPQTSPGQVLEVIRHLSDLALSVDSPLRGVAISIEGPIERSTGAIAPWAWQRLPFWKQVDIQTYFARHLRTPIVVDNDANFAALAEWSWGVGRGSNDFLYIASSEGIGGGIVINGEIYRGGTGLAGELGHMVIEEHGNLCFCGSRGCLTSFATERAILKALSDSGKIKSSMLDVIESARQGDAACQRVLSETGRHLGKALATIVRVLGPSVIAIGGTLGHAGEVVLDGLRSSAEIINLKAIGQSPELHIATILNEATEFGALAAILSEIELGVSSLAPWMLQSTIAEEQDPEIDPQAAEISSR